MKVRSDPFDSLAGTCAAARKARRLRGGPAIHRAQGLQNVQGIALVTVLLVAVIVVLMIVITSAVVLRDARLTKNDATSTQLTLLADAASDQGRLSLVKSFQESRLSLPAWLDRLAACRGLPTCSPLSGALSAEVQSLGGKHVSALGGATLTWRVEEVSGPGTRAWVRVAATATGPQGGQQTVLRRVDFGTSNIFDLAMLSDKVDCMFCHVHVNGDVGSTGFMRPGWGWEGDTEPGSVGSGSGSNINGSVYASRTVTKDGASGTLNGTTYSGQVYENYTEDKLPSDSTGDGIPDFPGLDAVMARRSATGTVTGGQIRLVPIGGSYAAATDLASVDNVAEGNLILEGTAADPIRLDKDIYATGDVIIKGYVTGRGAVYAGRNLYVAGNLINVNKADSPGAGVCVGKTDPDACAKANIAAGRDEVRLAAANNIVMGDFVDRDGSGNYLNDVKRQASDYFKAQFGLWGGTHYVRKGSAEEVRLVGGQFVNGVGETVPASQVVTYDGASGVDPYAALMKPGTTTSAGTFSQWMTDDEYAALLGTEARAYNTWRTDVDPGQSLAQLTTRFLNDGLPSCASSGVSCSPPATGTAEFMAASVKNGTLRGSYLFSGVDQYGQGVSGTFNYYDNTLRVAVNEARPYATQTTQLDAFLYANSRIAGKISPRGAYVNGGLIAREIGILAPGKNQEAQWWLDKLSNDVQSKYLNCDAAAGDIPSGAYTNASTGACGFSLNYDHRLRNGGFGFNLIRGAVGMTSEWKLDVNGTKAVQP